MKLQAARIVQDGSALINADWGDIYYSREDGVAESEYVYVDGNDLKKRFAATASDFCVGELGFGTGLNFFLTAQCFLKHAPPNAHLHYVSCEARPIAVDDLRRIHASWQGLEALPKALFQRFYQQYPHHLSGFHPLFLHPRLHLLLLWGEAEALLPQLYARVNAWYWDGFNPAKHAEGFRPELLRHAAAASATDATLSTFSSARIVKEALQAAGFAWQKRPGFGRKRDMISARLERLPSRQAQYYDLPEALPAGQNIAIIGAGIAGSASADALRDRHRVTLFDAGASASRVPVAVPYLHLDALDTPMRRYHLNAWLTAQRFYQDYDEALIQPYPVQDFTPKNSQQQAMRDFGALALQDSWTYASGVVQTEALLAHLQRDMPIIQQKVQPEALPEGGWKVGGQRFDAVIIASGWHHETLNAKVIQEREALTRLQYSLRPIRGQGTCFTNTHASSIICHDKTLIPMQDGIYVGGSFHPNDASLDERAADDAEHQAFLEKMGFSGQRSASFVGIRGGTRDYFPIVGGVAHGEAFIAQHAVLRYDRKALQARPIQHLKGLYAHVGLGSKGYSHAFLNALSLAAQINGTPQPLPFSLHAHLSPQRFWYRALMRRQI